MNNQQENLIQGVSIIIRSVGERTESLCKELIMAQGVPERNITILRKAPFSLALRASYEAGIALNYPWTFCVDADVLLIPGSIQNMLQIANRQTPNVLEIQGRVLDKFIGGLREAGNHLYRTSLLKEALECIPMEQNVIRPETQTLDVMKSRGYPMVYTDFLVGIHDFEQYYRDIYRKCFVQAHKHLYYSEIFLSYWPKQARIDPDYDVALKAFFQGLQYEGIVSIDIRQDIYSDYFKTLELDEKPALSPQSYSLSDIEDLVKNWEEPAVYNRYFRNGEAPAETYEEYMLNRKERFSAKRKKLGLIKYLVYLFGYGLEKVGSKIKRFVLPN